MGEKKKRGRGVYLGRFWEHTRLTSVLGAICTENAVN